MRAWSARSPAPLTDAQFGVWRQLVEARTGVDLSQHRAILQGGLSRRLRERGECDYDNYLEQVHGPHGLAEWQALVDCLIVKETRFFRQPEAFARVGDYLRGRARSGTTLDLWSVGCATGEEPYSLAMTAAEAIEQAGARCFFGVLATDICGEALRRAQAGRFDARRLEAVPQALRHRYFNSVDENTGEVVPELRDRVCWSRANLLEAAGLPPLVMDVIFCQNVLVYFRRWRVRQVLDALAARLKPGGLLVLGPGEAAHWQNPALTRMAWPGVSAFLRRNEN